MPRKQQYGGIDYYERKLDRVMERFGIPKEHYTWGLTSSESWVQFRLDGELYRFDHSVEKARLAGFELQRASDAFAQIVLALEDLARLAERGLYRLSTWVAGMKFLPAPIDVPPAFRALGFEEIPAGPEEVRARYRTLAKEYHPDAGGDPHAFESLKRSAELAMQWFGERAG